MNHDYPHITKSLDTITHISDAMSGRERLDAPTALRHPESSVIRYDLDLDP